LALSLAAPAANAAGNIESSLGCTMYYEGNPESPKIAITVDDLYGLDHLESILDLCLQYHIHMTFFVLGAVIKEENAALWQRVIDEGHEIGNHTFSHSDITGISADKLERQLVGTQNALNSVLRKPYPMRLFRPPYGNIKRSKYSSSVVLDDLGYRYVIMWNVDSNDASTAYKKTKNGSILLFHTNRKDVRCLTKLIPQLLEKGFEPVTVSELLGLPPMELKTGDAD
ncbi:MAG: polysaccharide deacetylase family protein, partial [Bacillota bacterium]